MLIKALVLACIALWGATVAYASEEFRELMAQGKALHSYGRYSEAIRVLRQAVSLTDVPGADQRRLAEAAGCLAAAYADAGQITNAEGEYRRALETIKKLKGAQSLDYAVVLSTLASLRDATGISEDMIANLRDALARYDTTGPSNALATIRIYLAQILSANNRYTEAEALLLEARAGLNNESSPDSKVKTGVLNGLCVLRFQQGRFEEAVELGTEYLQYIETALSRKHPWLVVGRANIATNYVKLGRFQDAVRAYQSSLALASEVLDKTDPIYGPLLANYAFVLRKVGRKAEAKAAVQKSKEIQRTLDQLSGTGSTVSTVALRSGRN
jgi:tetratricopeptide (TPR) repeat protein